MAGRDGAGWWKYPLSLVDQTGIVGYCVSGTCRAEMGLVRNCVLEAHSKFLSHTKKQCKNLRRLLLIWVEGPRTRCCDSIPCPRACFPDEGC